MCYDKTAYGEIIITHLGDFMLTQKRLKEALYYNINTGIFTWKKPNKCSKVKIGDIAGCSDSDGYIIITIDKKPYKAHRLVILYVDGYLPEGVVDHKDRIKYHNWYSNLREVSMQCQNRNMPVLKSNTSGVRGVCKVKGGKNKPWKVYIKINRKNNYLGYFADFDEAVAHRLAAEQCLDWANCDSNSPAKHHMVGILKR